MTKIEGLRNHILNATFSGDLPDTTLATFDDMVEAVEELGRFVEHLRVAGCDGAYDRDIERTLAVLEKFR